MRKGALALVSAISLALLVGCAITQPYRAHPEFEERARQIKTVALIPPDVKVYELSAGGVRQEMDQWSETPRGNVVAAVRKHLEAERGLALKEFDPARSPAAQQEFQETRPLFDAVGLSAMLHTYGEQTQTNFETKLQRFEYSLGPLPALTEAAGADAFLFVRAVDHVATGGRVALTVLGVLVGAATGVFIVPRPGGTLIVTALVDPSSGDILWFSRRGAGAGYDLRDPASAEGLVADVFEEFLKTAGSGARPPARAP